MSRSHEHDFERSWPTKNAVPVQRHYRSPTAPTYVVSGAGGNRESNAGESNPPAPTYVNHLCESNPP